MNMAKASTTDLDLAQNIARIIEDLEKGFMPSPEDSEDIVYFDISEHDDCKFVINAILDEAKRGSLFRVTFGMLVLCDPKNTLLHPDSDILEAHPLIAEMQSDLERETQAARYWNMRYHQVAEECAQLRSIVSACADAAGAFCANTATLDFMGSVPKEVFAVVESLRAQLKAVVGITPVPEGFPELEKNHLIKIAVQQSVELEQLRDQRNRDKILLDRDNWVRRAEKAESEIKAAQDNNMIARWIDRDKKHPNPEQGEKILAWGNGYVFEAEFDDGYWSNIGGDDFTHWLPHPGSPDDLSPAVAVTDDKTNFCALKSITDSQVNAVARAFWRRIYAYRNDFGIELPRPLPVEFMAHMATALTWVDKEPAPRITEQNSTGIDFEDLQRKKNDALHMAVSNWYARLTGCGAIVNEGDHVGYCCPMKMMAELESILAMPKAEVPVPPIQAIAYKLKQIRNRFYDIGDDYGVNMCNNLAVDLAIVDQSDSAEPSEDEELPI